MKELYYVNSRNEVLDFTKPPYLVKEILEIADFSHEYSVTNGKIAFGDDGVSEVPIVLNIYADTPEEYGKAVDRFFEVTEIDSINNVSGRLYYGEQYISCNLVGSQKKDWCMSVCYMMNYIRLATSKPYWITEKYHIFKSADITSTNNKRYPNKYSHRYANGLTNTSITNEHFTDCGFRIIVYGPAVKPQVIIGGYSYYVDVILEEGEYLEIDSVQQSVVKVMNTGIHVNCFHNRDKKNNVFRKIPPGRLNIDWSGKFDFDIILYEERSEPKW